ncbi:tetratricopeptide repeat protein 39, partial [Tremellales sp. Uapishka_1]
MPSFRKPSFSRKSSEAKVAKDDASDGASTPPRVRAASEEPNGETKPHRKVSLRKTSKRLSSLFSSSSLASVASGTSSTSTPSRLRQVSTPPSGSSTPPLSNSNGARYSGLESKGTPPDDLATTSLSSLRLGSESIPISTSPEPASPALSTAPGPPVQPVSVAHAITPPPVSTSRLLTEDRPVRERSNSLYSQWDYDDDAESSDDEAYLTPDEGLSEVEEEPEEPSVPVSATRVSNGTVREASPSVSNGSAAASWSVSNGSAIKAVSHEENVSGTGASTIQRSTATESETKVRRRVPQAKGPNSVDQTAVLAQDLDLCRTALELFLTSKMKEAEDLCFEKDPHGEHLYLLSAHGIINALKGMMTFDSGDLAAALEICKMTATTASASRRPQGNIVGRLAGMVRPSSALQHAKAMTVLERHAELVYAETSLMKAMLAIISGGDWMGLIREALNMRTAHGIYRSLQQFLEDADKNGYDDDIDMDFRSGVLLGTGTSSLMLSLLPGKVLKIAEVFGYAGDRKVALETLMAVGGWSSKSDKPAYDEKNEGLRRPVCDLILLTFHLVISVLMPVANTDVKMASNILDYNMKRYPNGRLSRVGHSALLILPEASSSCISKHVYIPHGVSRNWPTQALDLKLEYVQLQHMCLWDYACNYLMLSEWKQALDCFSILKDESNWSRAVYTYAAATCIIELAEDGDPEADIKEADKLLLDIPKLTKKIAGKSLPIEKFAARKARKFHSQGNRLMLPAMELAYIFGSLSRTPRYLLLGTTLPRIDRMLAKLTNSTPETYGNGNEYWDDYCLLHFLRGFVHFVARYQPEDATAHACRKSAGEPSDAEIDRTAEEDFRAVLKHGPDVQLDHWIVYHCHYELGRLYARRGDSDQAKLNFDVVMSGKLLEVNHHAAKAQGKYSLEGALMLKTHAALQALKEKK